VEVQGRDRKAGESSYKAMREGIGRGGKEEKEWEEKKISESE